MRGTTQKSDIKHKQDLMENYNNFSGAFSMQRNDISDSRSLRNWQK